MRVKQFMEIFAMILLFSVLTTLMTTSWNNFTMWKQTDELVYGSAEKSPFDVIEHCSHYDNELNNIRDTLLSMTDAMGKCHAAAKHIPTHEVREYMHSLLNDILREGCRQHSFWCERVQIAGNLSELFPSYRNAAVCCGAEYNHYGDDNNGFTSVLTAIGPVYDWEQTFLVNFCCALVVALTAWVIQLIVEQCRRQRNVVRSFSLGDTRSNFYDDEFSDDDNDWNDSIASNDTLNRFAESYSSSYMDWRDRNAHGGDDESEYNYDDSFNYGAFSQNNDTMFDTSTRYDREYGDEDNDDDDDSTAYDSDFENTLVGYFISISEKLLNIIMQLSQS